MFEVDDAWLDKYLPKLKRKSALRAEMGGLFSNCHAVMVLNQEGKAVKLTVGGIVRPNDAWRLEVTAKDRIFVLPFSHEEYDYEIKPGCPQKGYRIIADCLGLPGVKDTADIHLRFLPIG